MKKFPLYFCFLFSIVILACNKEERCKEIKFCVVNISADTLWHCYDGNYTDTFIAPGDTFCREIFMFTNVSYGFADDRNDITCDHYFYTDVNRCLKYVYQD